jgi:hypothetical protein
MKMVKNRAGFFLFAGLFVLLFLSACEKFELCEEPKDTVTVRFVRAGNEEKLNLSQLSINGSDSVFFQNSTENHQFSLPLSPLDTQTTYVFELYTKEGSQLFRDSLVVSYMIQDSLQSVDCGIIHFFKDIQLSSTSFPTDSVVTRTGKENENISEDETSVTIYLSAGYNTK